MDRAVFRRDSRGALAMALLMAMQALVSGVGATTPPPTGSGDWAIPVGDVTVIDLSSRPSGQILLDGDLYVNGSLTLDSIDLYMDGTSDGHRKILVNGTLNLLNGSRILPYNAAYCYDFWVYAAGGISVHDSTVFDACAMQISSPDFSISDSSLGTDVSINGASDVVLDIENVELDVEVANYGNSVGSIFVSSPLDDSSSHRISNISGSDNYNAIVHINPGQTAMAGYSGIDIRIRGLDNVRLEMYYFSLNGNSQISDVEFDSDTASPTFVFHQMDFPGEAVLLKDWNSTAGILASGGGGIVIENVTLQNVSSSAFIGFDWDGRHSSHPTIENFASLTIRNSTIKGSKPGNYFGVRVAGGSTNGDLVLEGTIIENVGNMPDSSWAGVHIAGAQAGGNLTILDSVIRDIADEHLAQNVTTTSGSTDGALYQCYGARGDHSLLMDNSTIEKNCNQNFEWWADAGGNEGDSERTQSSWGSSYQSHCNTRDFADEGGPSWFSEWCFRLINRGVSSNGLIEISNSTVVGNSRGNITNICSGSFTDGWYDSSACNGVNSWYQQSGNYRYMYLRCVNSANGDTTYTVVYSTSYYYCYNYYGGNWVEGYHQDFRSVDLDNTGISGPELNISGSNILDNGGFRISWNTNQITAANIGYDVSNIRVTGSATSTIVDSNVTSTQTECTQLVGSTYNSRSLCDELQVTGDGELHLINTSIGERGDLTTGSSEIHRYWYIDSHFSDLDGQPTSNATVTLYEANGFQAGQGSTGWPGEWVSFVAKEYTQDESTGITSFTPHTLTVEWGAYSNTTSVDISDVSGAGGHYGNREIVMLDGAPDAFPGDLTQDYDTDGDGWGDNYDYDINATTGLRENQSGDALPDDPTQWSDIDGDGYGDNYTYDINATTGLRENENGDAFTEEPSQWSDIDGDGFGDNETGSNPDYYPLDPNQWNDADGDGYADFYTYDLNATTGLRENQSGDAFPEDSSQWNDTDGDGWGDNYSWTLNSSSNMRDQNGDAFPFDPSQWSDLDGDGWGDNYSCEWSNLTMSCTESGDDFPYDSTQWSDADNDGYGDNLSGNNPDPYLFDSDNDGYNNTVDEFPWNPTQWEDADGDGLGDNTNGTNGDPYPDDTDNDGYNNSADDFPFDSTQWEDADGDGYGDNQSGNYPDPSLNDSDNDNYTNDEDAFPWNPTQWNDTDGDGWGDNPEGFPADDFPDDPTQWTDTDGDGYGDNQNGNNGDDMPNDPSQWSDYDGDGYGDNPLGNTPDEFPTDPSQWSDADGDGWGDNYTFVLNQSSGLREGQAGDAFLYDATQWSDTDGDGYGDNAAGNGADWAWDDPTQWEDQDGDNVPDNYSYQIDPFSGFRVNQVGDAFPDDGTQWSDTDGDGYGDNPLGNDADWAWNDPTQWEDADGDGLGDNPLGNNPDPTPGDGDNDGFRDYEDAFPNDPLEAFDTDGDGIGDNSDPDDDNDGWSDLDEVDCMTLMLDANSTPEDPDLDGTCNFLDDDDDDDGVEDQFDDCPDLPGNSTFDLTACPDSDGDTVSDTNDQWPDDPYRTFDSDGDGYDDPLDAFPSEPTQWIDSDMDGLGDNPSGANPDPYLDDSDNDGVINQLDAFPFEATQWEDLDSDGYGDNPDGVNPDPYLDDTDNDGTVNDLDLYRLDPSQSSDSDGDGYGDNPSGEFGDKFPSDPTQCCDRDGDGWGDNPNGTNPDAFPDDSTQWADLDGDGLGDNPAGNNPDPHLGDFDNDGVPDSDDAFPEDPIRSIDNDGDGISEADEGALLDRVADSDMPLLFAGMLISMVLGVLMTLAIIPMITSSRRGGNS